ncbi:UMUC-like DNA-repair protein [Anaerovibrio sp. JC8]|uniref:Y-family DNA polymerase n=1 Tax=Anaerovibrio sp. JC8 TaxID=1240085 RepID=UPI000A09ED91|nr:DNA methylase [Anaerovibrio sp. JC8]ORT99362.1 UMUC-like DNA-repair protein [Anaerovibrio sp. JC8]
MEEKTYIAIDLKSFYASVECIKDDLDPLTTNLVVADKSRSGKTICLAVTPALKSLGIKGRPRLFEVEQKVKEINHRRRAMAPRHKFTGTATNIVQLENDPSLALDFIIARPRMALYVEFSAQIYGIYLKYFSPQDIHSYSVDEVFIDATPYLSTYHVTGRELALKIIHDVLKNTGITATAGIGTNLYLAKVAMDIMAKKIPYDQDGFRIAELDEMSYRRALWTHTPITDYWRVGKGYERRLREIGLYTMGDIARCSIGKDYEYHNENLLYKKFGINAQLLIDHAWGYEPCTMKAIKKYRPASNSLSSGQVLMSGYTHEKGRLIVWEMADVLVLDMVDKGLVTDQIVLYIGYDIDNVKNGQYTGDTHTDHYGRKVPKPANGSINLGRHTSSTALITKAVLELFDKITDPRLLIRRVNITANHVISEEAMKEEANRPEQLDLFTDYEQLDRERAKAEKQEAKEKSLQHALLDIKHKYGKNAILKGANLQEGAMTIERNQQIGGHKA